MNKYGGRLLEIMGMDTVQNGELTLNVRNWCGMLGAPNSYWGKGSHLVTQVLTPAAKSIEEETGRIVTVTPHYSSATGNGGGKKLDTICVTISDAPATVKPEDVAEVPAGNMSRAMEVFTSDEFGKVHTLERNGEPWFVAVDVCRALDLANVSQALSRLDEEEKSTIITNDSGFSFYGNGSSRCIVSESGLYELVLTSRKPEAKNFKRWITHDVIPSIRKHGAYLTPQKIEEVLLNPDTIIKLATQIKEEQQKNALLTRENAALTGSVLGWNKKDFVVAAVNRLATAMPSYHADVRFKQAWSRFKTEMLHKHSINLESRLSHLRATSKHPSKVRMMDVFEGDVADMAVSSITAMCREADVDISDLLQNIPA